MKVNNVDLSYSTPEKANFSAQVTHCTDRMSAVTNKP